MEVAKSYYYYHHHKQQLQEKHYHHHQQQLQNMLIEAKVAAKKNDHDRTKDVRTIGRCAYRYVVF
jgi:hypothetical protein